MSIFTVTPATKRLVVILLAVSVLYLGGMALYYRHQNSAADPRVSSARLDLKTYQARLGDKDWAGALEALERADAVYADQPAYSQSFERGVIENNRSAVYLLTLETHLLEMPTPRVDEESVWLLERAREHAEKAERIYRDWLDAVGTLDAAALRERLAPHFEPADLPGADAGRILNRRVQEMLEAQVETPRRLSVTLTNLGIIARYNEDGVLAAERYGQALALWPDNETAKANLARLQGREPEGRSTLEKLFPPERLPGDAP